MKNPFIQMAVLAATMAAAFRENAFRNFKGAPSRSSRRNAGRQEERGIVPKAFRQSAKRYGHGVQLLKMTHKQYAQVPTIDEARRKFHLFTTAR